MLADNGVSWLRPPLILLLIDKAEETSAAADVGTLLVDGISELIVGIGVDMAEL